MDEHKKFITQCTIREVVKYVVIFAFAIIIVLYGIPRQVANVETELQRTTLIVESHTERIGALESLIREQNYTNREIRGDLDKILKDISLLVDVIQEYNEIRIMNR